VSDAPQGGKPPPKASVWRIVAVLVAIAIGVYLWWDPGKYRARQEVNATLVLLFAVRKELTEYYAKEKSWPKTIEDATGLFEGKYTDSIAITRGGGKSPEIEITATMKSQRIAPRIAGKTLRQISADGGKTWVCRAGTMPEASLPPACRSGQ
jgi:hypothetical protein